MSALLFSGIFEGLSFTPLEQLETYTEDLRARVGRQTPVSSDLVLVGIDREKYADSDFSGEMLQEAPVLRELQKDFPWSRVVWAELLEKLAGAGAKVIAFDLVFSSQNKGDARLREAIEKHRSKVVIGCTLSPEETERGEFLQLITPHAGVLPAADMAALLKDDRVGYMHVPLDADGVVRRVHFRQSGGRSSYLVQGGAVMESLAARALRKFGRPDLVPETFGTTRFRYGSAPGEGYKVHNIGDVLNPDLWHKKYGDGAFFRGKLVLIGPTAALFNDEHDTPFAEKKMSGSELHLSVMAAALNREFLTEAPPLVRLAIVLLSGLLAGALSFHNFHPFERLATLFMSTAAYWVLAQWFYDRLGWLVPVAGPLFALVFSGVLILFYDFFEERLSRMKLRATMGLYFSPTVLASVLNDPGSMKPKHADVTLLLTDLRNFTQLDELLEPQAFFELLNKVFELQTNAIMKERGNIEHFLGEQFLSYWGAPQVQTDAADRSLRAALALIAGMEAFHKSLPENIANLFGYGVALHGGRVLVGNKGSALRLDYGLVGDVVNSASRIEGLTKYYGVHLLVSREVFMRLQTPPLHRLIDRVTVKGKTETVELVECENPGTPPEYVQLCESYERAYVLYASAQFVEAKRQFDAIIAISGDGPSRVLSRRCESLAAAPPENWKGIWKMDSK